MGSFYQGFLQRLAPFRPSFGLMVRHLSGIVAAIALGVALAHLGMPELGGWIIVATAIWLLGVGVIGWWQMIRALHSQYLHRGKRQ